MISHFLRWIVLAVAFTGDLAGAGELTYKLTRTKEFQTRTLTYRVGLIEASDGGLVGITMELRNTSQTEPLLLWRELGAIPIRVMVFGEDGKEVTKRHSQLIAEEFAERQKAAKDSTTLSKYRRWSLPAGGSDSYFLPTQPILEPLDDNQKKRRWTLTVLVEAFPNWISEGIWEHPFEPFYFTEIIFTSAALQSDPQTAYTQAKNASPLHDDTNGPKENAK